jgi:hypothetical protein
MTRSLQCLPSWSSLTTQARSTPSPSSRVSSPSPSVCTPHSHYQARWLNLLAEYQYKVVHIPGRTNPADFLTRQRFRDGQGPARQTGYDDPGSALELYAATALAPAAAFVHAGTGPDAPRFLHGEFAWALRAALPADSVLGPLVAAAQALAPSPVDAAGAACPPTAPRRRAFVWRDGLIYRCSPHGDRLCGR